MGSLSVYKHYAKAVRRDVPLCIYEEAENFLFFFKWKRKW